MSEETVSEIRMRISAFLEKGDFAAALTEMDKIKTAAKGIEEEQINAARAASAASQDIAKNNAVLTSSAHTATAAMSGLSAIIHGNLLGGIQTLTAASGRLSTTVAGFLSKLSPVAMAFAIGYGIGTIIDKVTGLSDLINRQLNPVIQSMKDGWDRAFASADKLANLKLDRLNRELQDIIDKLNAITKESNLDKRLGDRERNAKAEADVAQIETQTPEGPERDRAVLARRRQQQDEQRRADQTYLATLDNAQKEAADRLAAVRADSGRELAAEETKTEALIYRAKTTDSSAAWKALGDQRRRQERLKQQYAEQEKRLIDELARIDEQQRETKTDITVRKYDTQKETAKNTQTETAIDTKETTIIERDRAQRETQTRERATARMAEIKRELAQRTAAGPSLEDQVLARFEAEKTPTYKRSIQGRSEQAALETYAAQSQAAQTSAIAALKAEFNALQTRFAPADREAAIELELQQRINSRLSPEDQALARFEAERTPTYKRSIKGRAERTSLETAPADAIAALEAELNALKTRFAPTAVASTAPVASAAPTASAQIEGDVGDVVPAGARIITAAPASTPVATDLKPLKTAVEQLATSQSDSLASIVATIHVMKTKYDAVAANIKTGDTY